MELIKEIVIENPPTYYEIYKKRKSQLEGKDVSDRYYLTANLFFNNNLSFHVVGKIIDVQKRFLYDHMKGLPKLEKLRLEFEYHHTKHIDLDNKSFFWRKLFFDILKTPSIKQEQNYQKKNKTIVTTFTIIDDDTKVIDFGSEKFVLGQHKMIFRIYGRCAATQQELKL